MDLEGKEQLLIDFLKDLKSFGVAFSGGIDSSLLLMVARRSDIADFCAVMAVGPHYLDYELERGRELCRRNRIDLYEIDSDFFGNASALKNDINRCYYCKKPLFMRAKEFVQSKGFTYLVDGANVSDTFEFRPGADAAMELGVVSPLKECGLEKPEIRELAKKYDIEYWDDLPNACLATRIPQGDIITFEKIETVKRGEMFLRECGLAGPRLRHHTTIARIEVRGDDFAKFAEESFSKKISRELKTLGFSFVTVDIDRYRPGST